MPFYQAEAEKREVFIMSHPLNTVISMAIKAAEQADELKNLPGAGKPLEFPSNSKVAAIERLTGC